MSVAGIDIGDQASCIAVARKRGVDVLLNKESKRETPTLVSFGAKQRQLGTDAYGSLSINPKNTIFGLKRLLGKKFQSPDVQSDIQRWPFKVSEGPTGGCLVHAHYLGKSLVIGCTRDTPSRNILQRFGIQSCLVKQLKI
jgi:heat shock 70kDa protein 4